MNKHIRKRISRQCAVCGRHFRPILYSDHTYRGGHYFGEIPKYRKRDLRTAKSRYDRELKGWVLQNIKPIRYVEYWECPKCFWK